MEYEIGTVHVTKIIQQKNGHKTNYQQAMFIFVGISVLFYILPYIGFSVERQLGVGFPFQTYGSQVVHFTYKIK